MYLKGMRPEHLRKAVEQSWPLLLPAGCIEYHGPHLPLGVDTLIAEEVCRRVADRLDAVIAPSLEYGYTGYAVSGPESGTMDVDNDAFCAYSKSVLRALRALGFQRIAAIVHHQGMGAPLALAIHKAASELQFEIAREEQGDGWWGREQPDSEDRSFCRIRVGPTILPKAKDVAQGDHAGLYETAYILASRPDLVDMDRLNASGLPWFCTHPENPAAEATAELGERMLGAMVDAWVVELEGWR